MSSANSTYAAASELQASATANPLVAAMILVLFVLSSIVSAERKDVTRGFDEVAHVSYVAHIQHAGSAWPALQSIRMLDPKDFHFTDEADYMAHPPIFYDLLAALGPRLEGHPGAVVTHRLIDVALAAIGLAAFLGLGLAAHFPRYEFYAYAVPIACIPVLVPVAGAVSNDNLALLGGGFATLGAWKLVATGRKGWLAVALAGAVAAGWAKLTGLILVGGMVGAVVAYMLWRKRMRWSWALAAAFALTLAAAPYIFYIIHYGGAVPTTPGFLAFVHNELRDLGWGRLPRRSFPSYFVWYVGQFFASWMPTLAERNLFQYAMLAIPLTALVCAAAGLALSLRRMWRRQETALDVIVICGALVFPVNFALQIGYTYHFYALTGWLSGPYLRFYTALAAIVPLAGLSLVAAIHSPRWRGALLGFLIAGPIVFIIFGAPLG
jgi:hypothetical protein